MKYIALSKLLKEMKEAEQRYIETYLPHLDDDSRQKVEDGRRRLKVFDELIRDCRADSLFPEDEAAEKFLLASIDRIAKEGGKFKEEGAEHYFDTFKLK